MKKFKAALAAAALFMCAVSPAVRTSAAETEKAGLAVSLKNVIILGNSPDEDCDLNGDGTVNVFDFMRYKRRAVSTQKDSFAQELVSRLYTGVPGTEPDTDEAIVLERRLERNEITAAELISGFINSISETVSDEEYVTMMYNVILGREPDESGYGNWCERIKYASRQWVMRGFIVSGEFSGLCDKNGISRGDIGVTEVRDLNYQLAQTVGRMYSRILGYPVSGDKMNSLVQDILDKKLTLQTTAFELAEYPEISSGEADDEQFVKNVIYGLLDREASADDISEYTGILQNGGSRSDVLRRAAACEEVITLYSSLNLGSYSFRIGSNFRYKGSWHHFEPSGRFYPVEDAELLGLLDYAENVLDRNGRDLSSIYKFCCSDSGYKYIEATKTLAQIENIGWSYFAEYAMHHYYSVCYYMAAQMDLLLELSGYQCRVVHATHGSGDHYWNQIYIDGKWTNYDVTNRWKNYTWDQMVAAGNYIFLGYVRPEYK